MNHLSVTSVINELLAWICVIALGLGMLGAVLEPSVILHAGGPAHVALAASAMPLSLALTISMVLAPFAVIGSALCTWIRRLQSGLRRLWTGPIWLLAVPLTWNLVDPEMRAQRYAYIAIAEVAATAMVANVYLSIQKPQHLARAVIGCIVIAAVAADVWLVPSHYPELHDVSYLVAGSGMIAISSGLLGRLRSIGNKRLGLIVAVSLAVAMVTIIGVDHVVPEVRWWSTLKGRHTIRLMRIGQVLTDVDGDGFSSLFWGMDCAAFDPTVHPFAKDPPGGGDSNCNGVDPPLNPNEAERGLEPAFGEVGLPGDGARLVILITVDTLRADMLTDQYMPEVWRYAQRGLVFERAYSTATYTVPALAGIFARRDGEEPFTSLLDTRVHTIGVAAKVKTMGRVDQALHTYGASAQIDATIESLGQSRNAQFVWVHLMEPHMPYEMHTGFDSLDPHPLFPMKYLSEVAYTDHHIARLFEYLDRTGELDKSVVVLTADHGEMFGEHQTYGHGTSGYEPMVRVPLLLFAPGLTPGVYPHVVSHRDIPATLLGALGEEELANGFEVWGRSWLRLRAEPEKPLHTFVGATSARGISGVVDVATVYVLIREDYKLVWSPNDGVTELFDMARDPDEEDNLLNREPQIADEMLHDMGIYTDSMAP